VTVCVACVAPAAADEAFVGFFATEVLDFSPGVGYEGRPDASLALGPPRGAGLNNGSTHVVTLGLQGSLTLGFADPNGRGRFLADGPGADFIVSENPFEDTYHMTFVELVRVQVSTDGVHFAEFPTLCEQTEPVPADFNTVDPSLYHGFAGTRPVLYDAGSTGPPGQRDPFDPVSAGGDPFDLADLAGVDEVVRGLVDPNRIRFVRLIDVDGNGTETDTSGNTIYDPAGWVGEWPDDPLALRPLSADIDALTIIHGRYDPPRLAGDADEDGDVDAADYLIVKAHLGGAPGAEWPDGDFTGDGRVTGEDLALLELNFGTTPPASAGLPAGTVPEPSALAVLALGAAGVLGRRRRHGN